SRSRAADYCIAEEPDASGVGKRPQAGDVGADIVAFHPIVEAARDNPREVAGNDVAGGRGRTTYYRAAARADACTVGHCLCAGNVRAEIVTLDPVAARGEADAFLAVP